MLEYEGEAPVGGRMFDAACADPGEAGAMAASLWELPAMTRHYHPHVGQAAASLLSMGLGASGSSQLSGPLTLAGTTRELAGAYDCANGAFRPAPSLPKVNRGQGRPSSVVRRLQQAASKAATTEEMQRLLDSKGCRVTEGGDAEGMLFGQHFR